jgi:VanZ family protein
MVSIFRLNWIKLFGVMAFALVVYASLMLPEQVERLRTGHWFAEHFVGYFLASAIICLGWRRPLLVAGLLTVAALVLEGLQSLTPSHTANAFSVLGGVCGAWLAGLIAWTIRVTLSGRNSAPSEQPCKTTLPHTMARDQKEADFSLG